MNTYHAILLPHVRRDKVVEKEERLGVYRHEYVVFELGDEAAVDQRFLFCKIGKQNRKL